jgi:hypothetical protein
MPPNVVTPIELTVRPKAPSRVLWNVTLPPAPGPPVVSMTTSAPSATRCASVMSLPEPRVPAPSPAPPIAVRLPFNVMSGDAPPALNVIVPALPPFVPRSTASLPEVFTPPSVTLPPIETSMTLPPARPEMSASPAAASITPAKIGPAVVIDTLPPGWSKSPRVVISPRRAVPVPAVCVKLFAVIGEAAVDPSSEPATLFAL